MSFAGMIMDLLGGLAVSVEIFILTLLIALPLGFVIALGRLSRNRLVAVALRVYISVVRGTPLMLQILFVYFAPYYLFGLSLAHYPRLLATVLAFALNYAAYFAEIYRGGILSVEVGQWEAAKALGLGRGRAFFRIVLPQMVKRVIPAVTNEVITLVKDTSLASVIGTVEMFTRAKQIVASPNTPGMLALVAAGVFYYVFNYVVAFAMEKWEQALRYYR